MTDWDPAQQMTQHNNQPQPPLIVPSANPSAQSPVAPISPVDPDYRPSNVLDVSGPVVKRQNHSPSPPKNQRMNSDSQRAVDRMARVNAVETWSKDSAVPHPPPGAVSKPEAMNPDSRRAVESMARVQEIAAWAKSTRTPIVMTAAPEQSIPTVPQRNDISNLNQFQELTALVRSPRPSVDTNPIGWDNVNFATQEAERWFYDLPSKNFPPEVPRMEEAAEAASCRDQAISELRCGSDRLIEGVRLLQYIFIDRHLDDIVQIVRSVPNNILSKDSNSTLLFRGIATLINSSISTSDKKEWASWLVGAFNNFNNAHLDLGGEPSSEYREKNAAFNIAIQRDFNYLEVSPNVPNISLKLFDLFKDPEEATQFAIKLMDIFGPETAMGLAANFRRVFRYTKDADKSLKALMEHTWQDWRHYRYHRAVYPK